MRKQTREAWKRCPKCKKIENQVKTGYDTSGSQRCKCKVRARLKNKVYYLPRSRK